MQYVSVLAAAVAAYGFGALWYMSLGKPWMKAAGITQDQVDGGAGKNPGPFIISAIMVIIVAGMMRHMFAQAGVVGLEKSALSGFGLGAFIAAPWLVTNYAYAMRPKVLTLIDGGYSMIGCTIIGVVLGLFSGGTGM